ncbi:MAG TPA: hypothetical protein VGX78_10735 [Pirellulales bacterium]|jgi:hypothetical protein|nr:hypothetical protein [Pirellulales bacterium]
MSRTRVFLFGWSFALLLTAAGARSDEPAVTTANGEEPSKTAFLRLARDAQGRPTALQTAIVRYEACDAEQEGLFVDLIAAVHVGEKEYYAALNDEFERYDGLLYELVAPENTRPKQGERSDHPVSKLQSGLKSLLALDFQLDDIDYGKANLIHADMSPDDFAKSMAERGESIWTILFRVLEQAMAKQGKQADGSAEARLLVSLFSNDRAVKMKCLLAEQFEDLEGAMAALSGPDGSTLITERNKKALSVLRREIEAGKKGLAIFYGAGHMDDMSQRLTAEFDLERKETRWVTAWDLRSKSAKKKAAAAAD